MGRGRSRSNYEWLRALNQPGSEQEAALAELRDYLLRTVLIYLRDHRSDLAYLTLSEIRQMAEDIAQDALLNIRANLDSFRGDSKFTTWAYRFAINQAVSELRHRRYRNPSLEDLSASDAALVAQLFQKKPDPERVAEWQNALNILRKIIQTELTERQRWATVAVYFQGISMAEAAEELEINVNALYKLLYDARQKIKAGLEARQIHKADLMRLIDDKW